MNDSTFIIVVSVFTAGLTVAIGLVLLSAKGWREKVGEMAGILALAAALTFILRHLEGMIP